MICLSCSWASRCCWTVIHWRRPRSFWIFTTYLCVILVLVLRRHHMIKLSLYNYWKRIVIIRRSSVVFWTRGEYFVNPHFLNLDSIVRESISSPKCSLTRVHKLVSKILSIRNYSLISSFILSKSLWGWPVQGIVSYVERELSVILNWSTGFFDF